MSQQKAIEHQTFSSTLIARNIQFNKEDSEAIALYFAFEDVNTPQLENKLAKKYKRGQLIVSDLLSTL